MTTEDNQNIISATETIEILNSARNGDLVNLKSNKHLILRTFDQYDATPVHYAARGGQLEVLEWMSSEFGNSVFLTKAKSGATPSHDAATLGHLSCLEFLLKRVDTPQQEVQDHSGATPLHLATRFDHLHVVQWLVEKSGCDILSSSQSGITPVHIAAGRGAKTCLQYFIRARDDAANSRTENGATPIYFAAQEGRLDCLKCLVVAGQGNPRQRANDGMTALHAAAQNGHLLCVIWLVTHGGVSVMERDKDGATPVHFAAARGHVNVLRWLLQNGAVAVKDELGGTPLHDAAEHGQLEVVRVLMEAGADVLARDVDGQTAEDVADSAGHYSCAECLRTAVQGKSAPYSKKPSQPFLRDNQRRFSISSARSAGRDLYRSIGRRKKRPPNTISSPNLASLTRHGIENGVVLFGEKKSSKSLPSSGRSPRMGHRPTFLQRTPPSPTTSAELTNERVWLRLEEPDTSQRPESLTKMRKAVAKKKIAFKEIASPDPGLPYHSGPIRSAITPPPVFKSREDISLESTPRADKYGDAIPDWKRLIMARKAQKELQPSSAQLDNRLRSKSLSEQSVRSPTEGKNPPATPPWIKGLIAKRITKQSTPPPP